MSRIFHQIANYRAPHNAHNTADESSVDCSRMDICRCLITVGNPSFFSWENIHELGFIRALNSSIISKFSLVMQNLHVVNNHLCRHPSFDRCVSDEKRIISYNLGMGFAKYYSQHTFGISNLLHIEFLKKQNAVVLHRSANQRRSREPDLVGQDHNGHWHLFEAKGVSGSEKQLTTKITDAKDQLSHVQTIHGATPDTRTACATYLGLDRVFSQIEDPEGNTEYSIQLPEDKYFIAYYKPFSSVETQGATELGIKLQERQIDGINVVGYELERGSTKILFGLEAELQSLLTKAKNFDSISATRQKLYSRSRRKDERYSVGPDGFFVQNLR